MTDEEEKSIIDRVRKNILNNMEEARKNAFPNPPQSIDDDPVQRSSGTQKKEPK